MITFKDLETITSGEILSLVENTPVREIIIDSRRIIPDTHALFIAIQGKHHDGHDFAEDLYRKGVRQFMIQKEIPDSLPRDVNIIKVKNTVEALQEIAVAKRNLFDLEVIGITGSNGKTMVKEWLSQLLESSYYLVKNPKSYNSQVGVPLSVWKIEQHHQLGIFEAGISLPGEMEKLERIIQPVTGIFTNIGPAHNAGFESMEQKVREKARLFKNSEMIIYCKDHPEIDRVLKNMSKMLLTWGRNEESVIRIMETETTGPQIRILILYKGMDIQFNIPFTDKASLENLMHCISLLLYKDFPAAFIQEHLNQLSGMSMRLEIKKGIAGCYLIDDSYSNDLASLGVALEFMTQQPLKNKRTIILSDMLQSGLKDAELYGQISALLKRSGISRIIGIGPGISGQRALFKDFQSAFYSSTTEFLNEPGTGSPESELILIKGARKFGFERIVRTLQQKIHETVLEINLDALVHNLGFYRSKLKSGVKMMVMVKAVAYGSGSNEIAHLLQYHNVDYLGVAYTDEAVALRNHGIHLPIMVMNPSREDFEKMVKYQLEPEIYGTELLKDFYNFLKSRNLNCRIHLKLDTGMHRLGFESADLDELADLLKKSGNTLQVASIFSHLAGADSSIHDEFSSSQAEKYLSMAGKLAENLAEPPLFHLLNSAGILRFPDYQFDMVRLGIGLYGYEANHLEQEMLRPISTFKTSISQIREVAPGETIGYDRKGMADRKMRIATIAVGYADGFRRSFSNGAGSVSINGKRAAVVGNVCMDMSMVDVTDINAEVGDEVILFGEDPGISELAEKIGTIPYEILTNVSDRVKRVFYSE